MTLAFSFALVIAAGTLLLTLPASTPDGMRISFTDALFTATSATCVTGLIVRSTPAGFTLFGKTVILVLIQLGALGIMTFSIALILTLGRKISKAQEMLLKDALNEENIRSTRDILKFLLIFTFGAEAVGTGFLFFCFKKFFPAAESFKMALFHSVSAFCNAGFSLLDANIMCFAQRPSVLFVFSALIILGGIGFVVLLDIINFRKVNSHRFKVHTKIVITSTIFLLVAGTLLFYAGEKNNTLSGMRCGDKWMNAFFQSVTARTAGFNTVDISKITPFSKFALLPLMFIGASPGGTGGGIKTITFVLMLLVAASHLKHREDLVVFGRNIPAFFARRAFAITVYAALIIFAASGILLYTEHFPFENIIFEVVSAFGTVGLSTGITCGLNDISKYVITFVMFMGRLGPLTIALAAIGASGDERVSVSYADERIMLG